MGSTLRAAGPVLAAVLLLTGCSHTVPPSAVLAGAPSASPSPSPPSPTPPSSTLPSPADSGAAGGYPFTAETYSRAAVTAWLSGDRGRLDELRATGVRVFESVASGYHDMHFTFLGCDPATGTNTCQFFNDSGDELVLRLPRYLLGAPHAITGGRFDPVAFPTDERAYAQEALTAWASGDTARLDALATADARATLDAVPAGERDDVWSFDHGEGAAGSTYLTWRDGAGDQLTFRFVDPGVQPGAEAGHRVAQIDFRAHP